MPSVVASSYNGQPTDDARFMTWLTAESTALHDPLFAVLGVGDHNWADTHQAIPEEIDERLIVLLPPRWFRASADTSISPGTLESSPPRCGRRCQSTSAIRTQPR